MAGQSGAFSVDLAGLNTQPSGKTSGASVAVQPIVSFEEFDDYVYDVKWSPVHPALFAAVDGSGNLHLYNLNQETEVC